MWLAFDTSAPRGSVAVGRPGEPAAEERLEDQRAHVGRLVPAIERTLDAAGVGREALAGVLVGRGPGSFTGVRVAAGTAKGLVRALGVPLHGFSSLEAAAVHAASAAAGGPLPGEDAAVPVCVLFDARGERVYASCHRVHAGGVEVLLEPTAGRVRPVLDGILAGEVLFAGDGARRHRALVEARGWRVLDPPAGAPDAGALLHLLALSPEGSRIGEPGRWEPDYLRASRVQASGAGTGGGSG